MKVVSVFMALAALIVLGRAATDHCTCEEEGEDANAGCSSATTKKDCTKNYDCVWHCENDTCGRCRGGRINDVKCDQLHHFKRCENIGCTWREIDCETDEDMYWQDNDVNPEHFVKDHKLNKGDL